MLLEILLKHVQVHISTFGDAASCDQQIEAMSKVCDGLRGDAFVAAQEVGFHNLCEVVDGRPLGIDTVIRHMRGMVFPFTEHESKELFRQYCRPGGPFVQTKCREYETVCLATTTLLDTLV